MNILNVGTWNWSEIATLITASATGIAAAGALLFALFEYRRQGAQKRAEHFSELRKRLKENETFRHIFSLLEVDDPELLEFPFEDKRDLLGLMEEVALGVNSRLIRPEVAHYMFGYYAIRCWQSDNFWHDINRKSPYWSLFATFAKRMEKVERSFKYESNKLRF